MKPVTELIEEILANVKAAGCTCQPDVTFGSLVLAPNHQAFAPVQVDHDEDCELLIRVQRVQAAKTN